MHCHQGEKNRGSGGELPFPEPNQRGAEMASLHPGQEVCDSRLTQPLINLESINLQ